MPIEDVEKMLLKRAKAQGKTIDQSEIYDSLSNFEIDDDTLEQILEFFAENNIVMRIVDI